MLVQEIAEAPVDGQVGFIAEIQCVQCPVVVGCLPARDDLQAAPLGRARPGKIVYRPQPRKSPEVLDVACRPVLPLRAEQVAIDQRKPSQDVSVLLGVQGQGFGNLLAPHVIGERRHGELLALGLIGDRPESVVLQGKIGENVRGHQPLGKRLAVDHLPALAVGIAALGIQRPAFAPLVPGGRSRVVVIERRSHAQQARVPYAIIAGRVAGLAGGDRFLRRLGFGRGNLPDQRLGVVVQLIAQEVARPKPPRSLQRRLPIGAAPRRRPDRLRVGAVPVAQAEGANGATHVVEHHAARNLLRSELGAIRVLGKKQRMDQANVAVAPGPRHAGALGVVALPLFVPVLLGPAGEVLDQLQVLVGGIVLLDRDWAGRMPRRKATSANRRRLPREQWVFCMSDNSVSGTRRVPPVVSKNPRATAHGVCRILFGV